MKTKLFLILTFLTLTINAQDAFITKWKTTTPNESITIPTSGSGYNYTVNWGDGITENDFTGDATHEYTVAGEFNVSISGDFPRISFIDSSVENKSKILEIVQWVLINGLLCLLLLYLVSI